MSLNYEFQHIHYAIWGAVGLIFWIISFFYIFKKPQLFIPKKYKKRGFPFLRSVFFLVGVAGWLYIAFALAGPRRPMGMDKNTIEVNDIFVVLDLSRSMLAEDLKPNRFEAAKQKIQEFVSLFPQDRIGIVIFAEKVFTLLPLSTDLNLINKMVAQIKLGALGDGTNIGDALALGVGRLLQSLAKNKVMILLTDGVSNVGTLTPLQAAEMAAEQKIKIYTIGIGGARDARIPVGPNMFGVQRYQMIPGGSVDEKGLQEIARLTGGKFYMARDNRALENVLKDINKLERTQIEQSGKIIYEELFFKFLLNGVLLLIAAELGRRLILREGP
ncbi:VWA domain-containing protein [Bacteriovorax stolpii]|uniref:Aerotolerance regulator BatA n=1 Tax=Bacteriovorax stolpii TaxID=960 RepID=A0A2K9NM92_BACTC|nr:VWA domain-containing protein [Bacteriovorax stolpii]AUN96631.1 aerotolerance regulator BatA [Bacteriovorax stolpii]QDK43437.1 VWA domain-containing protein [Bacteriovorax stolpii]TDP53848.1 Ca-activated chloride channel family protein [Bacteriovorax stolpii]